MVYWNTQSNWTDLFVSSTADGDQANQRLTLTRLKFNKPDGGRLSYSKESACIELLAEIIAKVKEADLDPLPWR